MKRAAPGHLRIFALLVGELAVAVGAVAHVPVEAVVPRGVDSWLVLKHLIL